MNRKGKVAILALSFVLILSLVANGILAAALIGERKDRYLYDPDYAVGGDGSEADVSIEETTEPRFQIETQIITLSLPEAVQDHITVNTEENEHSTSITYASKDHSQEPVLFSVVFTKDEPQGNLLGVLNDDAKGKWKACVNVTQIDPNDWSEEDYSQICALQEWVNDIMIQLQEDPRFVPNRPNDQ